MIFMFRVGDKVVLNKLFLDKNEERSGIKEMWQNESALLDVIEVRESSECDCDITVSDGRYVLKCLPPELIYATKEEIKAYNDKESLGLGLGFDFNKNFYVLELSGGSVFVASHLDAEDDLHGLGFDENKDISYADVSGIKRVVAIIPKK